ncbi:MAG: OPT/YSL family transporter [Coriobacteriia bacterium]|nr:OPT/YSL family transporter [Coriobacteriia bacterium]
MRSLKGQLTLRGILIGCVGCIIITTSSMYIALKMGALPWPIIFAAIISLFFLKALGRTNLHEVNVTHTIMSSGAMVAGGVAFTIPGIWILGFTDAVSWWQMLIVALSGVVLGLICTIYLRRHFIESSGLEYPIGEATSQTLLAGDAGGKVGGKLFGSMGFAGIYTLLRDQLGAIPALLLQGIQIPGIAFGIYNSPMLLAIGFIVGTASIVAWFIGALVGNFGIVWGGFTLGLWGLDAGREIASSLGMGLMMGCGFAVVVKVLLPAGRNLLSKKAAPSAAKPTTATPSDEKTSVDSPVARLTKRMTAGIAACLVAAVALVLCFALGLGPIPSIIVVLFVWVTTAMSAQSVGQTGIDPMEIFALIVLLIVAAFSSVSQVQLFFVAGVIAVACGLTGDLMNDFKAGHNLGTDPRAQSVAQAIGGALGAVIAVAVISILVQAYGHDAFGLDGTFIATQASIVATMISGIPSIPSFIIGLILGFALYLFKVPSMMIGLGIYLPFYLSFAAFFGLVAKLIYEFFCKRRRSKLAESEVAERRRAQDETGLVVSSGLLGGESIIGVILALVSITLFLSA